MRIPILLTDQLTLTPSCSCLFVPSQPEQSIIKHSPGLLVPIEGQIRGHAGLFATLTPNHPLKLIARILILLSEITSYSYLSTVWSLQVRRIMLKIRGGHLVFD